MRDVRPLNYIIGPLFSGKTRLAQTIAETLPGATFLGLERLIDEARETRGRLEGSYVAPVAAGSFCCLPHPERGAR